MSDTRDSGHAHEGGVRTMSCGRSAEKLMFLYRCTRHATVFTRNEIMEAMTERHTPKHYDPLCIIHVVNIGGSIRSIIGINTIINIIIKMITNHLHIAMLIPPPPHPRSCSPSLIAHSSRSIHFRGGSKSCMPYRKHQCVTARPSSS